LKTISKSFELRYFSQDPKANGETDFKGGTSVLDTEQRVSFLNEYAHQMEKNLSDVDLYSPIVTAGEVSSALGAIKSQPLPEHRQRIVLDDWVWTGHGAAKENRQLEQIEQWSKYKNIRVTEACLYLEEDASLPVALPLQDWRCFLEWTLPADGSVADSVFSLGEAATIGFDAEHTPYYISGGEKIPLPATAGSITCKIELDFENRKYNLYLNHELAADFVEFSDLTTSSIERWLVSGKQGLRIGHILGVGYKRLTENEFEPFSIGTFIDEDFTAPIRADGWNQAEYDPAGWSNGTLPIVHGGQRYAGEDILMRKEVYIDEVPAIAELYIESLTPGGELYINGRLAAFIEDEYMRKLDITSFLREGNNLIAVKVYSDKIEKADKMTHSHTDLYTGWFAGRMHLDLLPSIYIEDVFTWTDAINESSAIQKVKVSVKTQKGLSSSKVVDHNIRVKMMPWFPEDGPLCAQGNWTTSTYANLTETTEGILEIASPNLWTSDHPNLYKVVVELYDSEDNKCDDYVVTIGIRTVSQDGGIFRINGKPELLRAPLLFGARPPMETIAAWEKCPPAEYYIEEMLMVQKMNGNGLRMSVHDERIGGINDPRVCEFADQLGIMLVWQTSAWLRLTSATNLDLEGMATCIRQVRNHSSIVIWQPTNHPSWKNWDTVMKMYRNIYDTIIPLDTSRLISPSADSRRLNPYNDSGTMDYEGNPADDCDPVWTAPLICRGNMDYILGYGNEWPALRQWPNVEEQYLPNYMDTTSYIPSFIDSKHRAYFNFEHDETAGQPNWDLHKGKPTYQVNSYEWRYEEGSIGRTLDFNEWKTSQAWQAFEAYEVIRKSRQLDYDGFSWCCLRGGPNTGTYQKSLVDYYGQPKLVYYANRMVFQDVLAGSGNVDIVYGPEDEIPVTVLNLGDSKKVEVVVEILSAADDIVETHIYNHVILPEGRTVTRLESYKPSVKLEGLYSIRYTVNQEGAHEFVSK
jgi:hypothetical protein